MSGYSISPELDDLFEIWQYIAQDSEEAADRVQAEFYETFSSLAQTPGQGHNRKDLTRRQVLFFPLYSYLFVYQPVLSRSAYLPWFMADATSSVS